MRLTISGAEVHSVKYDLHWEDKTLVCCNLEYGKHGRHTVYGVGPTPEAAFNDAVNQLLNKDR